MSSFYRNEGVEGGPPSVADETERGGDVSGRGVGGMRAVEREDTAGTVLKGRTKERHDPRKYRYDAIRGRGEAIPFEVTRDSIMSAVDAGDRLHQIHVMFGLEHETEGILHAFDSSLWFCHSVNSGSTLVPGRSRFFVTGVTNEFDFGDVRNLLGVDMRRFFRAYADDVAEVNKRILRDYDPNDPVKAEQWGWLMEVAYERGLGRYPHLAHDSADACRNVSPAERQALRASKALTVGSTPNAADRLRPSGGVTSADRYDSTVGDNY